MEDYVRKVKEETSDEAIEKRKQAEILEQSKFHVETIMRKVKESAYKGKKELIIIPGKSGDDDGFKQAMLIIGKIYTVQEVRVCHENPGKALEWSIKW